MSSEDKIALANQNLILQKLHNYLLAAKRFPHKGQAKIIRAIFNDRCKVVQGQCGRSYGKTETVLYVAWRYALTYPNSEVYIICPEIKQAKKIYWLPRRLQYYGPQEFVAEHRDSELRIVFTNGSYIILDGCENYDSLRGIKPNFVVYDEFQHHSQFFDEDVMQPNLSGGNVTLCVFGTPPRRHCYYSEFRENLLENIRKGNPKYQYFELPSVENPSLDKEWLSEKKADLVRRNKLNVWLREYEGKQAFDTEHAVFPFLSEKKHVFAHNYLLDVIKPDRHKLEWYALYDPGTATCFAALLIAVNPYTSQIYILGEIYAKDKRLMTAKAVYDRATEMKKALYNNDSAWVEYYDEAATWFANEIRELYSKNIMPTRKQQAIKTHEEGRAGESILNTLMDGDENKFLMSDKCENLLWEMTNYVVDEQGKYPRKNDHLVDLLFYFVQNSGYTPIEDVDKELMEDRTRGDHRKIQSIEDLWGEIKNKKDLTSALEPDYYDYDPGGGIWN